MVKKKFRIKTLAHLDSELIGLLEQQLLLISQICMTEPDSHGKSVHRIRRSFKKSRAILRLLRDAIGYAAYYRENRALRDLHRKFSAARESNVLIHTLNDLRKNYPDLLGDEWYTKVIANAKEQHEAQLRAIHESATLKVTRENVEKSMVRIEQYRAKREGFDVIEGGLNRIYRQGQTLAHKAHTNNGDVTLLHNFRKRSKYLQYQVTMLRPLYPVLLKATAKSLRQLTDTLGYYNDYHLAKEKIPAMIRNTSSALKKPELLFNKLTEEQQDMLKEIRPLAYKLYAEPADQFTGRIRTYWEEHMRHAFESY